MSFNLENARVGDLLVCYLVYLNSPKVNELLGKFIVVSKGSSEANNNKTHAMYGDSPELTLHVLQSKEDYSPISDYVGRNCTYRIGALKSEIVTWSLAYRPEEG